MENGDRAFERIYKKYYKQILRYIQRIVGRNCNDHEDICTEVFVIVKRDIDVIRNYEKNHLRRYLYKVAAHRSFDYLRRRKTQKRVEANLKELMELSGANKSNASVTST